MIKTNVVDDQGKVIHVTKKWEKVTAFTNGSYRPGKSFRLYVEDAITLTLKGTEMARSEAEAILLLAGYHNFVCDEILEAGSDALSGVFAIF